MAVGVELRPMGVADVPAVADLERLSFDDPWPLSMFLEELSLAGRSYLVAESEGEIVAYGGVMRIGSDAHIMTLAVSAPFRRRGLGTRLMASLIDGALQDGAEHLTLEVRISNEAARALYEKFGFSTVGMRPGYYKGEDALVMWAIDASGPAYARRLAGIREAL
jgi:ribosomal-protein-alanine N-acetyltransferase